MSDNNDPDSSNGAFTRVRVKDRFSSQNIHAIGSGHIGPVITTLNSQGDTVQAAAKLYDAPFEIMVITDPNILRIFGDKGDTIDMDILHPWPVFRLEPIENVEPPDDAALHDAFKVGILVDITNAPKTSRFGTTERNLGTVDPTIEGDVHRAIRLSVEAREATSGYMRWARKMCMRKPPVGSSNSEANDKLKGFENISEESRPANPPTQSRSLKRNDSVTMSNRLSLSIDPPESKIKSGYALRQASTRSNPRRKIMTNIPDGIHSENIQSILNDIVLLIKDPITQEQYLKYVFDVRKEVARDPIQRAAFHAQLEDFVNMHNVRDLHNQVVRLMRSGAIAIYHMPVVMKEKQQVEVPASKDGLRMEQNGVEKLTRDIVDDAGDNAPNV
ncbi:hypothetical protein IQ07DRAFT_640766 [Pyrenochaeta sp. DS3sAY3a]|nr:hypothetical protein IQ07DRAFT_640766 [Pyrenochaeta sp. DS3sAY3a]